ncbi:gamma-glutamylcyclotransferase family protein [Dyadobacter fermentans]|uniref:AIG2 family protein n=1 Tax=Dyadobacter fermentans (strain ATCC 700827 / DSM 18053 / CIP 107007 / KCTC 52180 / NS114) TaxID=471854 RepID=C6W017_DYAFD|nr:gamma-glutamylcyclotransferase family protein [Dyadobacter fermentans]ACT95344.1 AIG2 family protein [Dyadobacter fermentans DSM 18053]
MEKLYNIFTYGTLMQAFHNPYARKLRASSEYLGKGYFNGRLFRVEWYPGALFEPDAPTLVRGEIYQLHSLDILKELDEYEDVLEDEAASLYVRKVVPVRDSQEVVRGGEELVRDCWVYLYNQPVLDLPLIEDGYFKTTS